MGFPSMDVRIVGLELDVIDFVLGQFLKLLRLLYPQLEAGPETLADADW